ILALMSGSVLAGTVVTLDQSINGEPVRQQTIELTADKVKMTSPENQMIYRGDQNKVWIVKPEDKAYVELTAESMSQMKARMDQGLAMMQQRMASLPPEQRKQVEAMMAARGMGSGTPSAPPQITYEKAGDPKKINGYTCTPFHVTMTTGAPPSEFCMAALSDLGLSRDDLKAFVGFGKFMSQMGGTGAQRSPMAQLDFDSIKQQIGFDAFPVQTSFSVPGGQRAVQTTLKSVRHEDPPAGTFDLPAGYTRQDMGAGMGHGPRAPG
ncbi:MAG TPA: DUF4412 domain-containing protein, partial [Alphaproteobacteria bacterium]|nr:DUF4412 domain-containing protein [Alphaproteobacteria bacterium]